MQDNFQSFLQRRNRQWKTWRLTAMLAALTFLITWSPALASAQTQTGQTYWLGRSTGTEYVFDTRLPAAVADAITAADARAFVVDKTPREFPPLTADGTEYTFVEARLSWDNTMFDRGQISLVGVDGTLGAKWFDRDKDGAEGKALAEQLTAQATAAGSGGAWHSVDALLLIAPNTSAEPPTVRVPIPETTLAKIKMNELGQQTQAGLYYPTVKAPADLDAFRAQMLTYGNLGRRDPDFRKNNGAKTATDLSGDTVQTLKGTEKVFKNSQTPPYFTDHVLNDKLNQAAQFQAEYIASINRLGHDGPRAYRDPKTGKTVDLFDFGTRAEYFGAQGAVEAAGMGGLGDYPHSWMAGDTHFRPWFNVYGCHAEVGYGAARAASGSWYFVAVATADTDPDCVNATVAPTAEPTAEATVAPTAEPTAEATAEPTAEATQEADAQPTTAPAQAGGFPLLAGRIIEREQKIPSESGNHYLMFQPDSNVVVYTADDQYVWGLQSITDAYTQTQSVQMQTDGNFVVRGADDQFIWSALTENPDPSAYLTLTPEGVLQLVSGDSGAV